MELGLAVSGIFYTFIAKPAIMGIMIGRHREMVLFNAVLNGDRSEFVAVYGRRRVGKTFLIRTAFEGRFTFQLFGVANTATEQQLENFAIALKKVKKKGKALPIKSWFEAFDQLADFLEKTTTAKKVVFIDELPWLDTPNSGFIQALEYFWNSWASARKDIILVVCGSAASWMINKLINNKGGLHNRVTKRIKVLPFTLQECEQLVQSRKTVLNRYQIIQLYMVFGGIPFYWDEVSKELSAEQNIQQICFGENGLLRTEFTNLFGSLFSNAERHIAIANALAVKVKGLTRDEIIRGSGLPDGGSMTRLLTEMEENGFIRKYVPFEKKMRTSLYQLTDHYTLFYLRFIKTTGYFDENKWLNMLDKPTYRAWSGYAFEQVCLYHVQQLKHALGIAAVDINVSSWRSKTIENGAQVDLVIDRRDQVINLCEMKFSINPFLIDKKYDAVLRNKMAAFKKETGTRKSVFLTMVTTFGLQKNTYAAALVQNDVDMNALFHQ
ncbi:MAG: ATP-binding protein [Chitinophagaceae bacterium]